MKVICSREKCTGCWACVNACSKSCISMVEGTLKHLFPKVDQSSCVDCGKCVEVCPAINTVDKQTPQATYAAWAKSEEEYRTSTSGGVASILSRKIIKTGGIVYGCEMGADFEARHARVVDEQGLFALKGSKYVQSSIGDVYKRVKTDLKNGKEVLFVGTPCQIAGIRSYLKKEYPKLYLVDLICHGVPSSGFLKDHIANVVRDDVDSISFRNDNSYVLSLQSKGTLKYYSSLGENRYEDIFLNSFMDGYSLRPSCHNCNYACSDRVSDITLGDFWGLNDGDIISHPHGISCVLINSDKGQFLIDKVREDLFYYQYNLEDAVRGNSQLRTPMRWSIRSYVFYKLCFLLGPKISYSIAEFDRIHRIHFLANIHIFIRRKIGAFHTNCND